MNRSLLLYECLNIMLVFPSWSTTILTEMLDILEK